jgi:hypothetical protein
MPETEEHARADQNQFWLPHLSLAFADLWRDEIIAARPNRLVNHV